MKVKYINNRLQLAITNGYFFRRYRLNAVAKVVLLQLINHINSETLELYPSYERLCSCCGIESRQLARSIKELVEAGIIEKLTYNEAGHNKKRRSNYYNLTEQAIKDMLAVEAITDAMTVSDVMTTDVMPATHGHSTGGQTDATPVKHGNLSMVFKTEENKNLFKFLTKGKGSKVNSDAGLRGGENPIPEPVCGNEEISPAEQQLNFYLLQFEKEGENLFTKLSFSRFLNKHCISKAEFLDYSRGKVQLKLCQA